MIEVGNFVVPKDQNHKISLYPDNFIVKYYLEQVRGDWINYNEIQESERERIYNINNYDVYSYETVYLKDRDMETYDMYDYYTNSEDGLGTYMVYKDNDFGKSMSLAEAQAKFNSHGSPIVLTDGTFVVK